MLEVDINLTSDGELVMIHDYRLERTTNGAGFVYEHNLSDLDFWMLDTISNRIYRKYAFLQLKRHFSLHKKLELWFALK